jgi:hypothetical protein
MSGSVAVEPDPAYPAGHAVIRVGGAGQLRGSANFRIKRDDYDEGVFGPNGWQVSDALLLPDAQSVEGNDLLLHIGPSLVQHVVSGVYRLAVPAAGVDTTVFWPDLPLMADEALNMVAEPARDMVAEPYAASALRPQIPRPPPGPAQIPRPPPAPPEMANGSGVASSRAGFDDPSRPTGQVPDDTVRVTPSPTPERPRWLVWAILLVVVLIAAGGGYFGYRTLYPPPPEVAEQAPPNPPPPANPPPPEAAEQASPTPAPGLDLTHMSAAEALRSSASPEALLREAERRMSLDAAQRSEALLLMQGAADPNRDYAPAHAALGRLYDPGLQHPPEIEADARQAAIHYRAAVQGGDNSVVDARAALKAYLEQRSQHGDLYAPLILKEFWQ